VGSPMTLGSGQAIPLTFGIVGVGKISEQYFASLPKLPGLKLVAVADLDRERAAGVAAERGVDSLGVEELLADDRIEAVLNLTIPAAHVDIDTRALDHGKHVYSEKPLALATRDAINLLNFASEQGLRVGCAPDTILGTGIQTARAALDGGMIGKPVAAAATWLSHGHEAWHPAPEFYYQHGGGPLFDMGPYYVSALVTLLGPVASVSGVASRSTRDRVVATGPRAGTHIDVEVETHVSALLRHTSGVTTTVTMSFEAWASRMAGLEVYGTSGTIAVPDPNRFSDPVQVVTRDVREWTTVPVSAGYAEAGRGYGLADMAHAIATGRPHRASAELALHVLEIMSAILRSADEATVIQLESTTARPAMVPFGATPGSW